MIAVILPTRGQIFSQTFEEILDNLQGFDYKIYWSHDNPIPQCFNKPLERALKHKQNTHFWFVEEDMIIPPGTLKSLMSHNDFQSVGAIACDYPLVEYPSGTILYNPKGKAYFTGTGCLLVKREVLERLPKPIFRSDIRWSYKFGKNKAILTARRFDLKEERYGHHDITFGLQLYIHGTPIEVSDIACGQRKLKKLGPQANNVGQHEIVELTQLNKKNYTVRDEGIKEQSEELMTEVMLKDGSIVNAHPDSVSKWVAEGRAWATQLEYDHLLLDFSQDIELAKEFKT
jgi:hypothetical protein